MAGASNYNANKYLNTEGNYHAKNTSNTKLTFSEEKKKQFQQEYLKEFNDEMRAKNWVSSTMIYFIFCFIFKISYVLEYESNPYERELK